MTVASMVTIPGSAWLWPVLIVGAIEVLMVLWSYRRAPEMSGAHRVAFALKVLGIALLGLCLLEPLYSGKRAESGANLIVVAADNSGTMNVKDQGSARTRGEIMGDMLVGQGAQWLARVGDDFQVRRYMFDSRVRRSTDFSELVFDGKGSGVGTVLKTIAKRYTEKPLAGIVLLSDGGATDVGEQFYDLEGVPPVYPVAIGGETVQRDLSLTNVSVTQTAFEDAPVTIQADVEAVGYAGREVSVAVTDSNDVVVERNEWKVKTGQEKQVFRFRLRPDRVGVLFYRVAISESGVTDANEPEVSSEATVLNNERTVVVDRGKGPYRVLYVSGRPNWEYKFLKRAVDEDEQVQLVGLLRVAKREPKYDWRGRTGEQSNPLYRGYDGQEQTEGQAYDQPVLVRLNTRDDSELSDGFPKTAEELFEYHAIILDDVGKDFFTQDQMELLRKFVGERGGGFMMLGGMDSFREGEFDRTAIGGILPVYLDRIPETPAEKPVRLDLTREGWLEPWTRLRDNELDERRRIEEMPGFEVLNRVGAIKAGARVVASIGTGRDAFPALVVHRYGNGRAAALTIGDVWRWGLLSADLHEDMDKFWRQTVRWLVADVPERTQVQVVSKTDLASQPVELKIRTKDKDFGPLDSVLVTVEVRDPNGETVQLRAEPSLNERGLFEVGYVPRDNGGYFVRASVRDAGGIEVGSAETGWTVDLQAREFASIHTNRALLEKIARETGGRMVEADELDAFAAELPSRDAPITNVWVSPLWDLPGVLPGLFVAIVACFAGEWLLRRWKQMP